MLFTKKKFYTLLDIKKQIVYIPIIFVLLLAIISFISTLLFFNYQEKNKIKLLTQSKTFYKKDMLKNYINNIKYNTSASFDDEEVALSNTIHEFIGYLNSYNVNGKKFSMEEVGNYINNLEKRKQNKILLFNTKNLKVIYGKNILEYLRMLTNSKLKTETFSNRLLKNIEYIGDDNLMYWTDRDKRKFRLSYFKHIPKYNWIIGSFSQIDDLKKLTKKTILDSLVNKSKTMKNVHLSFFDLQEKKVYNLYSQGKISSFKDINKFMIDKHKDFVYNFSKYQFKIYIKDSSLDKQIKRIKYEYDNKLAISIFIIVFISLFMILMSNLFGRFINTIFNRYNRRLETRKTLYKKWKDRYELAIIASNDGLWDINLDTYEIFFSNKWLEMFGYNRDKLNSFDSWVALIHEDDRNMVLKSFQNHVNEKKGHFICEYRLKENSGNYRWVLVRGKAFRDKNSNRMLMMSMDIDKRMKLTKELRNVELLTEFGRIVIFRWLNDENFSVKFVSKSINTYGYESDEFLEKKVSYWDFVHNEDKKTLKDTIQNSIDNNLNSFTIIHRVKDRANNVKWVYNRTILLKDDNLKIIGFYGYLNDITKIKMNEEDLKQKVKEELEKNIKKDRLLVQQNKLASMGEMLGNIAHQWRQPLNNISLLIHFIRDNHENLSKEMLTKSVKNTMIQVDYMSQTIDDFRNFYQPTKDKNLFNIKTSINRSSKIVASLFEQNSISLEVLGEEIEIQSYENEFEQVIVNILNNASDAALIKQKKEKFSPEVKIDIKKEKDYIKVSLLNNCGNVEKDILDKMFEPYFTTKFENQGTGIGLYMAKVIIEKNMNGKIEVFNKNEGVEFIISLYT